MTKIDHSVIIHQSEEYFDEHGDTHLGVGWPTQESALTHYKVALDVIQWASHDGQISILDFGCGAGGLLDFITHENLKNIQYTGLDISQKFLHVCQQKYPNTIFIERDIFDGGPGLDEFDYIIANGIFTQKCSLTNDDMWAYMQRTIRFLWGSAKFGLVFNVMSKHVDWERNDLFHLPLDTAARFLTKEISRKYIVRNDYQFYDYTIYVYR